MENTAQVSRLPARMANRTEKKAGDSAKNSVDPSMIPFMAIVEGMMGEQLNAVNLPALQAEDSPLAGAQTENPQELSGVGLSPAAISVLGGFTPPELAGAESSALVGSPSLLEARGTDSALLQPVLTEVLAAEQNPAQLSSLSGTNLQPAHSAQPPESSRSAGKLTVPSGELPEITLTQKTDAGEAENAEEILSAQKQFFDAVGTAKKQLKEAKSADSADSEPANVFAAAPKETPRTDAVSAENQPAAAMQEAPLAEQLTGGIREKITGGKTEFTMKLKPESLGEITVRLTEEDGKKTLHILTAGSQAAKLINEELSALREAVRPMQVQVHEAVYKADAAEQSGAAPFDMTNLSGQGFAQQRRAFFRQSPHGTGNRGAPSYEEAQPQAVAPAVTHSGTGRLNLYI